MLRAGILLPGVLACLAAADLGTRLIPLRDLAHRPWEAVHSPSGRRAPFLPSRRVEKTSFGDLGSLGGVPFPADWRREVFTTDAAGFRNSAAMVGTEPVGAVLFGSSFVAGGGLSDEDTLAVRLREEAGFRVFNAGMLPVWSTERLDRIIADSGLGAGGTVVYGLSALAVLPHAPGPAREGLAPEVPQVGEEVSDFGISRLGILLRRLGGRLAAVLRLAPGGGVVRRTLTNGDAMLFLAGKGGSVRPVDEAAVESWVVLRDALEPRGIGVLVLLIPGKNVVYGDLLLEPLPVRPSNAAPAIAEALAARGVPVLDLGPSLKALARAGLPNRRYVFWRDDTHWNPYGVRVAAAELSAAIQAARPGGQDGPSEKADGGPTPQRSIGR